MIMNKIALHIKRHLRDSMPEVNWMTFILYVLIEHSFIFQNPIRELAWLFLALIITNLLVFLYEWLSGRYE